MFEQLHAPDHVLALRLTGKVTGEDIHAYKRLLDEKLAANDKLGAYLDITGFSDMNADALIEGAKADLELLAHFNKFSRYALVTDKEWPEAIMRFVAPLIPILEMKTFSPEDQDAAMAWVSDLPGTKHPQEPAVRMLKTNREDVYAFEVDGTVTAEEMPELIKTFEKVFEEHDKVRLLVRMKRFAGFSPKIFMQEGLAPMKLAALPKVERYAIVGAPAWMRSMIGAMNPAFKTMELATFALDDEKDAWKWVDAEPMNDEPKAA